MGKVQKIKISDIVLDSRIYPRSSIDHKRVAMFEENMRDGFEFEPIHLEVHPDEPGKYHILDGAHRFHAYKGIGQKEVPAEIIKLNGKDPLLYAARQAIGPRLLNDEEARNTARRAYQNNPKLSSEEIGKDVGRSRQAVDNYIMDLRAAVTLDLGLKVFRMEKLGIPQERISGRLELSRNIIRSYLVKMPELAKSPNSDLKKGFTASQVAEKHGWPEPMVWALKLEDKNGIGDVPQNINRA
jgi:biotin operon repressor